MQRRPIIGDDVDQFGLDTKWKELLREACLGRRTKIQNSIISAVRVKAVSDPMSVIAHWVWETVRKESQLSVAYSPEMTWRKPNGGDHIETMYERAEARTSLAPPSRMTSIGASSSN